ncbi:MAG TPA: hypothetical protein VJ741_08685 [Solirubrobacteraceae bacterium]|nr:hypothetical protein [Solirubrobacteraceae bacterium]
MKLGVLCLVVCAVALCTPAGALADEWFPDPANATWQYLWSDSTYNPSGTVENVVVQQQQGSSFTLAWADPQDQPPAAGATSISCSQNSDVGTMSFEGTNSGLINTNWNSCPPPVNMPILCANPSPCSNSISSTLYTLIWGNRVPVLSEPLLRDTTWNATGGGDNSVESSSRYLGVQLVKVPAFPRGVSAAVVRTNVAQSGALGDPYGSGVRTTWWVYGVGPVRIVFDHSGGNGAPVTTASLLATNLRPMPPPPDADYFPLVQGMTNKYKWTNKKHLSQPEVESVTVSAVANRSSRISVKSVSGPIRVVAQYGFDARVDGLTNLWGSSSVATLVKFPRLGHKRHFFTPIDLMVYGYNPVLPGYPQAGNRWGSGNPADFQTFGVTGRTKIIGVRKVHVPAGTFAALEVRSTLTQRGHPFGSGVRTCWFAPGRGLVKLVFKHRDGSVSVVQLMK